MSRTLLCSRETSAAFGARIEANRYSVEWVVVEGSEVGLNRLGTRELLTPLLACDKV